MASLVMLAFYLGFSIILSFLFTGSLFSGKGISWSIVLLISFLIANETLFGPSTIKWERLWILLDEDNVKLSILTTGIEKFILYSLPAIILLLIFSEYLPVLVVLEIFAIEILSIYFLGFAGRLMQIKEKEEEIHREEGKNVKDPRVIIFTIACLTPSIIFYSPLSFLAKLALLALSDVVVFSLALYLLQRKTSKLIVKLIQANWV